MTEESFEVVYQASTVCDYHSKCMWVNHVI